MPASLRRSARIVACCSRIALATGCRSQCAGGLILAAAALLLSSQYAIAANLSLFSNAPPGAPIVMLPQNGAGELLIGVRNDVGADPPAEYLTAWQLRLEIIPDPGAIGSVTFVLLDEPSDYVMESIDSFGPTFGNMASRAFAQDFEFPSVGGVQVPAEEGANLLAARLTSSAAAAGRFGVFALDGLVNSQWTDAAEPVRRNRSFANVPNNSGPVRIADVIVTSAGDFDRDLDVDGADLLLWQRGLSPDPLSASDLLAWETNFGAVVSPSASSTAAPEPTSAVLLLLAAAMLTGLRRRPKHHS